MDEEQSSAGDAAESRLCAVARELLARTETGETIGFVGWEVHADGTFTRIVSGAARDERFTLAGLALNLAMEAARD